MPLPAGGSPWHTNPTWDRALGMMQFLTGTFQSYGVDASGDGRANPHNALDAIAVVPIVSWRAEYEGTAHVTGTADVDPESITHITLTESSGAVLLDGAGDVVCILGRASLAESAVLPEATSGAR